MPVETQKRIAEHIAMNGGPFWMKGKSGQRATGPQEVDPVGQPKTSYVPNTQMLVKAAGVCVAAYFGECSVRLSVLCVLSSHFALACSRPVGLGCGACA